jgi:hypothetical protein
MDALNNPGGADPKRVPATVCAESTLKGADSAGIAAALPGFAQGLAEAQTTADQATAEPPLRCYVTGTCPAPAPGTGTGTGTGTAGTPSTDARRRLSATRVCLPRGHLRVVLRGPTSRVRAILVRFGGRTVARDRRGPRFTAVIRRSVVRRSTSQRLTVVAVLRGGGTRKLRRTLPACGLR